MSERVLRPTSRHTPSSSSLATSAPNPAGRRAERSAPSCVAVGSRPSQSSDIVPCASRSLSVSGSDVIGPEEDAGSNAAATLGAVDAPGHDHPRTAGRDAQGLVLPLYGVPGCPG